MKQDELYLGYYLHLIQDIIYRHFVYDKYHWNPLIPSNVEKLHRDYAIGNYYVVQKYRLKNEVIIPADFDEEPINQICTFDLDSLVQNMNVIANHESTENDAYHWKRWRRKISNRSCT